MSANMSLRKKSFLERHGIIEIIYLTQPNYVDPIYKRWIQRIISIFSDLWTFEHRIENITVNLKNKIYNE